MKYMNYSQVIPPRVLPNSPMLSNILHLLPSLQKVSIPLPAFTPVLLLMYPPDPLSNAHLSHFFAPNLSTALYCLGSRMCTPRGQLALTALSGPIIYHFLPCSRSHTITQVFGCHASTVPSAGPFPPVVHGLSFYPDIRALVLVVCCR